jgi:hypothetical protein
MGIGYKLGTTGVQLATNRKLKKRGNLGIAGLQKESETKSNVCHMNHMYLEIKA